MSNEQQQQQISPSFSSPEFSASQEEENYTSGIESSPASTTTTTKMVKSATGLTTTTTTVSSRVVNTTRDSGFGDSIAEDTSQSSASARNTGARTEHDLDITHPDPSSTDIVLKTRCFPGEKSKLKSVEEDIDVIHPVDLSGANLEDDNKEFITIVKTTKMTTKVKQIKPNAGSGKKNKKKNKKQPKQSTSVETSEAATSNTGTTTNGGDQGSDEDRTSNISSSKDEEEDIEKLAAGEAPTPVIKVDINKSTDEYVFQTIAGAGTDLNQTTADLNSTVLDSEEILSDYSSNVVQQTTTIQINGGPIIEQTTVVVTNSSPETGKTNVLNDVTRSVANQPAVEASTSGKASNPDKKEKEKKKRFNLFARFKNRSKSKTDENKGDVSPSQKRKLETSQTPTNRQPQQPNKQLKSDPSSSPTIRKYVLLSDEEKDGILYEKPECVERILGDLITFSQQPEQVEAFHLVPLTTDMGFLTHQLCPMISRALDLLRHDRVESFERLASQLSTEYDEKIRKRKLLDPAKIDLIFNKFLKEAVLEKNILKGIQVDKSRRPLEEQIQFDTESATSLKWLRRFSNEINNTGDGVAVITTEQQKLGAKLNEKLKLNIDEDKLREQLVKQPSVDEENFQEPSKLSQHESTLETTRTIVTTTQTTTIQQQISETNVTGSCGITPPPTPQNELSGESTTSEHHKIKLIEGKRIILDTVKEPPIVFLSDFETDNKLGQTKRKIEDPAPSPSPPANEPVTSVEATVATLKKGDEANQGVDNRKPKSKKSSTAAFSCLSCAGGGLAKFEDEDKPTTKVAKKKAKKTTTSVEETTKSKSKAIIQSKARSPVRIETDLSKLSPPNTFVDVPTVISLDIQGSPTPAKEPPPPPTPPPPPAVSPVAVTLVKAVDETTSEKAFDSSKFISLDTDESAPQAVENVELVTTEAVEQQAQTEISDPKTDDSTNGIVPQQQQQLEEGPMTPPTTPELKSKSDIKSKEATNEDESCEENDPKPVEMDAEKIESQVGLTGAPVDLTVETSKPESAPSSPIKNLKTTSTDITRIEINTESKRDDNEDVVEVTKTIIIKKNTVETSFEGFSGEVQLEPSQLSDVDVTLDDVKRKLEVIEFNFPKTSKPKPVAVVEPEIKPAVVQVDSGKKDDSKKIKKAKKEKKIKLKPEDAATVSCFSCKSRKARQEKEKQEAESKKQAATSAPNLELKIEVPKSKPIDATLFQGLDNNVIIRTDIPPDQTTEIITITRMAPDEVVTKLEPESEPKQAEPVAEPEPRPEEPAEPPAEAEETLNIELKTTSMSMIGSTSIKEDVSAKIEPPSVETPISPVLSDDIVKLPELKQVEVNVVPVEVKLEDVRTVEAPKPTAKLTPEKPPKKPKTKKTVSCFSTKKNKAAHVDKEKAPTSKPVETSDIKTKTEPTRVAADVVLPPSDWMIGLDRAEHISVVRKDPENYEIRIVEESLAKPAVVEKQEVEIEMPSVIDAPPPKILIEESLGKQAVQLSIDSPGAYVKINREPDHAVIPIVVQQTTVVKTQVQNDNKEGPVATTSVDVKTEGSKTKHKKTSPIDLPLIGILGPKSGEAKKKTKKDKKAKKNEKSVPEKKEEQQPLAKLEPRPIEIFITSSPDIIVETVGQQETPIVVEPVVEQTPVEESKDETTCRIEEDRVVEETPAEITPIVEIHIDQAPNEPEKEEEEPEPEQPKEETQVVTEVDIEQPKEPEIIVTTTTVETKTEESGFTWENLVTETKTTEIEVQQNEVKDVQIDVPPLDIHLPELSIRVESPKQGDQVDLVLEPETKEEVRLIQTSTAAELPAVEVKPGHTSILDMPLIDVLMPKSVKQKTDKKKPKEKKSVEKKKHQHPPQIYIDMPIVDLVDQSQPSTKAAPKKVKSKSEKKPKSVDVQVGKKPPNTTLIDMPIVDILTPSTIKKQEKKKQSAVDDDHVEPSMSCFSCKAKKAQKNKKKANEPVESSHSTNAQPQVTITRVDVSAPVISTSDEPSPIVKAAQEGKEFSMTGLDAPYTASGENPSLRDVTLEIDHLKNRIEEVLHPVVDLDVSMTEQIDQEVKVEVETEPPVVVTVTETEAEEEPVVEETANKPEPEPEQEPEPELEAEITIKSESEEARSSSQPIIIEEHSETLIVQTSTQETSRTDTNEAFTETIITTHIETPQQELNITQVHIEPVAKPVLEIIEVDLGPKEELPVPEIVERKTPQVVTLPAEVPLFNMSIDTGDAATKVATPKKHKPPKEPKPTKKTTKSTVSCFSCKSRKAKQEKNAAEATPAAEAKPVVANIYTPASPVISVSSKTPKLDPELFKNLDRPTDVAIQISRPEIEPKTEPKPVEEATLTTMSDTNAVVDVTVTAPVIHIDIPELAPQPKEAVIETPEVLVVDVKTPPKKPPRGLVDVDIDQVPPPPIEHIHLETSPVEIKTPIVKVHSPKTDAKSGGDKHAPKTSILDLPLIDILVPREAKKVEKGKMKQDKKSSKKKPDGTATATSPTIVITTSNVTATAKSKEIDSSLFRGLDPDRIDTEVSDKYKSIVVKGTSVELNEPEVEVFVEKTTVVIEPAPQAELKSEHTKPIFIDLPTIIDIERPKEKYEYKSPSKPLPHKDPKKEAKIGAHHIGEEDGKQTVAPVTKSTPKPVEVKPTPVAVNANDAPVTKTIEFPSSFAPAITTVSKPTPTKTDAAVRSLTADERKLLKSKQTTAIDYLKQKSGFKIELLEKASTGTTTTKKELKAREKQAEKVFKRSVKILAKERSKPLTYASLRKKLEKVGKSNTDDLNRCIQLLESEIESGTLVSSLRSPSGKPQAATTAAQPTATAEIKLQTGDQTTQAATTTTTADETGEPGVLRRFPSLTWRQANERARILFYKGRTPSIHYNEKRDSFRVSMLAEVIKDGQHKMAEVPVTDDDVRRLLNSFGLYWDGESISLLAKSDEIFTSAQQEAFDFILSGAASEAKQQETSNLTSESTDKEANDEIKLTLIA